MSSRANNAKRLLCHNGHNVIAPEIDIKSTYIYEDEEYNVTAAESSRMNPQDVKILDDAGNFKATCV